MLRIILLSLFWAVCSTCLVRPWFWKGVKEKDLYNHSEKTGFSYSWDELYIEVVCFIVVFLVSIFCYLLLGCRLSLLGSLPMIILCLICQSLWDYQGAVCYNLYLFFIVFFAFLWMQDGITSLNATIPLNNVESIDLSTLSISKDEEGNQVKSFVSADDVKSLFNINYASGPTYNNGKRIFAVTGGRTGNAIVVVDKNCTRAELIPCAYSLSVASIRAIYPTLNLKPMYVSVSDQNVPYGLFAVAKKNWLFGSYKVNSFLLVNLISGEGNEFTQEELPSFVTTM